MNQSSFALEQNSALKILTPRQLLPKMVVSIFVAESLVMFLLAVLPPLGMTVEALIDSSMLLIMLSPTFYFFHYRPLLQHYQERQKVNEQLFLSEERLALTLDAVNDGLCDWKITSDTAYFSDRAETMLGYHPGAFGNDMHCWRELIHPDDKQRVNQELQAHLQGKTDHYETEHRLKCKDGRWVWVLTRGKVVQRDENGRALRMVGTHTDITVRKRSEEALRKSDEEIVALNRRLMLTSEEEKKHLAQDLHDEFGQVVTAFQLGVEMLRSHSYFGENEYQFHCSRLLEMVGSLEANLRHICDHLRPIMLEDVGLIETLRWYIKEFLLLDNSVQISFDVSGIEGFQEEKFVLPREIKIVFFRIFQEALNNVVKHAGATKVEAKIEYRPDMVSLSIADNGRGFSVAQRSPQKRRSFGLLGMRERSAAIGGKLEIDSSPEEGTRVRISVPLREVKDAEH